MILSFREAASRMAEEVRRDPSLCWCREGRELKEEMERAGRVGRVGEVGRVGGEEKWPDSEEEAPEEERFDPPFFEADLSSANRMMGEGKVEEALKIYESAGDSPLVCAKRGSALLKLGRVDEAEREGKKALQQSNTCALAERVVGEALLTKGEGEKAMEHICASLSLDPTEEGEDLKRRAEEMKGESKGKPLPQGLEEMLAGGEGVKEMVESIASNPECMKQISESPLFKQVMGSLSARM